MENKVSGIAFVTKISVPETLMSMEIGKPVLIPTRKIKTATLRTAATRLQQTKKARFYISTEGLVDETKIIRLK